MMIGIKKMRFVSFLLAAAAMLSSLLVWAGTANAADPGLRNPGFEEPLASGNIPGWSNFITPKGSSVTYEVTNEKAHSGTNSLKMTDTDGADGVAIWSNPLEVVPGETYTGSVWIYIEGASFLHNGATVPNRASFIMRFYNEAGQQVGSDTDALIHHTGQSKWVKLETKPLQAPANAKTVRVIASLSNFYQTSGAFYDDFEISGLFPGQTIPAARALTLSGSAAAHVDSEYAVQLSAEGAAELYAIEAEVTFDPTQFEFQAMQAEEAFHGGADVYAEARVITPGRVKVIVSLLGEKAVSGDKAIATLRFMPLQVMQSAAIALEPGAAAAKMDADETGESTVFTDRYSLNVQIRSFAGDVDGNGKADLADLIMVAQAVGTDAAGSKEHLDVNGDGKIDIADLSLISLILLEGEA